LKLHRVLTKSKSALVTHMRTKRIELANYLFFRRVSIALSLDCFCLLSTNAQARAVFLHRQSNEQTKHV
jgi:hypothetical protein